MSEKKQDTLYFVRFMVGRKTEKKRLKRSIDNVQETMKKVRHAPIDVQLKKINQILQEHYATMAWSATCDGMAHQGVQSCCNLMETDDHKS